MLRQLLTLLAVLTGLTATVAPVQALDLGARAVQVAEQGGLVSVEADASVAAQATAPRRAERRDTVRQRPVILIQTPAVMLQADRAHE
ncbi:hypothetical protein [Alteraurantiacibacter buctensis]|uniref:Uncharacterized protein n=1 Tax=Alteraurantiacibacter buctensis TaxID=1503981 RepID=A0A844YYZ2_9SPHN|nr:hypothetical protein [Alteraurantiacibacter buctensis]MXO72392.1 hypothetical protein [Alteraurantiacibacter buctensis]